MNTPFISVYHDTRGTARKQSLYPVKIRVFQSHPRVQKLYKTKFKFTEKEFENVWTVNPRANYVNQNRELSALERLFRTIADCITPFSFEKFEKILYRDKRDGNNVFYHYDIAISECEISNRHGTMSNYKCSLNSLKDHCLHLSGKAPQRLLFPEVTVQWLNNYEQYMTSKGCSLTTVGIYLRPLKTMFNNAKAQGDKDDYYPFGRGKNLYQIPASRKVKKTLQKAELKKLFEALPATPEQEKAKDFWFFSYICNGMNMKDIAHLQYSNLNSKNLTFFREKTKNTSISDLRSIVVTLTPFVLEMIAKYGNKDKNPKRFIFDILDENASKKINHNAVQRFVRFVNQHIKKLATNMM